MYPLYVFLLALTKVFLEVSSLSASEKPCVPKISSQREKTSSWVYVRGRSVRYAKPVVEKTSSSCLERETRTSGVAVGSDRAERETKGREEKDVDILTDLYIE